jgi:hypothetical protein
MCLYAWRDQPEAAIFKIKATRRGEACNTKSVLYEVLLWVTDAMIRQFSEILMNTKTRTIRRRMRKHFGR